MGAVSRFGSTDRGDGVPTANGHQARPSTNPTARKRYERVFEGTPRF